MAAGVSDQALVPVPRTNGVDRNGQRRAAGLGLLGIGLGITEVAAPAALARLIGAEDSATARAVLRTFGLREIASGIGILARPSSADGVWARVAGDALDLALLGAVLASSSSRRGRAAASIAAIAGIAALDVLVAKRLGARGLPHPARAVHLVKSITINRPPSELYAFWHDFQNLPRFIAHLKSVEVNGRISTWRARGPAHLPLAWQAEVTQERMNESIAWRSLPESTLVSRGVVRFVPATGDRGTQLTIELVYEAPLGKYAAAFAKLFGVEPGQEIEADLRRLKQILETGEVMRSDASIHRGRHPARPSAKPFKYGKAGDQ